MGEMTAESWKKSLQALYGIYRRVIITLRRAWEEVMYWRARFATSQFGVILAAGQLTFLSTALGSIFAGSLAESVAQKLIVTIGDVQQPRGVIRGARLIAEIASGVVSAPKVGRDAMREIEHTHRFFSQMRLSFISGLQSVVRSWQVACAAAILGGPSAALIQSGTREEIVALVSTAIAAAAGSLVTTGLGATLDVPLKAGRAKARERLARHRRSHDLQVRHPAK
jgi:hypothetical protein